MLLAARKFENPILSFLVDDWYFSIPMISMSVTGMALLIWRLLLNRKAHTDMDRFLPEFQAIYEQRGLKDAIAFCRQEPGLIPSKLYVAGLEAYKQGTAAMRRSMANALEFDILPHLHFLLAPILAIAKIATMVGLLGTVISMINTFTEIQKVATSGSAGGIASKSGEIGLALVATALGLLTAIPLVFAHVLLKDGINRFDNKARNAAQKLLTLVQNVQPGSRPAKPKPTESTKQPAST
jgi:biopolymer transport protein ExbB